MNDVTVNDRLTVILAAFALSILATVIVIGKPRKPLDSRTGMTAALVSLAALLSFAVLLSYGLLVVIA